VRRDHGAHAAVRSRRRGRGAGPALAGPLVPEEAAQRAGLARVDARGRAHRLGGEGAHGLGQVRPVEQQRLLERVEQLVHAVHGHEEAVALDELALGLDERARAVEQRREGQHGMGSATWRSESFQGSLSR